MTLMRTILCYGDSNTWGYRTDIGGRFAPDVRWCGVLSGMLGGGYTVIEEGLNCRKTAYDDPENAYRNGTDYLAPCLDTHSPVDLVIIMLGSNDLKARLNLSAERIAEGMERLLGIIKSSTAGIDYSAPQILLLCPPHVSTETAYEDFFGMHEKSKRLGALYAALAQKYGCGFFDVSTVVSTADLPDGLHLSEKAHAVLGERMAALVKEMFEH
jgi:lysophospholipase L1-like esterase